MVNNLTFHAAHIYSIHPKILWLEKRCMHVKNNNIVMHVCLWIVKWLQRSFVSVAFRWWGGHVMCSDSLISLSQVAFKLRWKKCIHFSCRSTSNDNAEKWYERIYSKGIALLHWSHFIYIANRNISENIHGIFSPVSNF